MRKLLYLAIVFCSLPSWATWTCKDGATGCTSTTNRSCVTTGTSCNITVASTTAGAVGVVCADMFNAPSITITVSGAGTWVTPAASHGTNATAGGVECAYNLSMTGGVTTIAVTFSNVSTGQAQYFAFAGTLGNNTFDVAGVPASTAACTSCTAVAFSLSTSNNYILIQKSVAGGTMSALSQSYTSWYLNGNGIGFKINQTTAGTTPAWTQSPSSAWAGGGIAIYETSGAAPTCNQSIALMGVGCR